MLVDLVLAQADPDLTGSKELRALFVAISAGFILFSALDGWREGLGRKLFGIIALTGGVCVGYFGASFWGGFAGRFLDYPPFALRLIGGFVGGVGFCIIFGIIGMLAFRPTRKIEDPQMKRIVGVGGAIAGTVLGFITVMLLMVILRVAGQFGYSFVAVYKPVMEANQQLPEEEQAELPPETDIAIDALTWIARMNNSLEGLPGEGVAAAIDPVPEKAYRVIDKILRVTTDPEALRRMAEQPETRQLLDEPVVQAMLQDEELAALARERDIDGLMRHPNMLALTRNEELIATLESYDLEGQLDKALEGQTEASTNPGTNPTIIIDQQPDNADRQPFLIIEPIEES